MFGHLTRVVACACAFSLLRLPAGFSAPSPQLPGLARSESRLVRLDPGADLRTLSVDRALAHVLWISSEGRERRIVFDGVAGPLFDEIRDTVLSGDGRRHGYAGRRRKEWFVVLDGREYGPYEASGGIFFSPDGRRAAFGAHRSGREFVAVVDGEEQGPFVSMPWTMAASPITFSPDGRHVAFRAGVSENGATSACIVVDGKCGRRVRDVGRPRFSPDGLHVAYWALPYDESRLQLFVDDEVVGSSEKHSSEWLVRLDRTLGDYALPFAPDHNRLAFVTSNAHGDMQFVVNGTPEPPFDRLGGIAFSRDCSHWAYVGAKEKAWSPWLLPGQVAAFLLTGGLAAGVLPGRFYGLRLVHDGVERLDLPVPAEGYSPEFPLSPTAERIVFGSDGRLAYATPHAVVVDGVEGRRFDWVSGRSLTPSPDGQHHAYFASTLGKPRLVVDDAVGPPFTSGGCMMAPGRPCAPFFSPDGRRIAYAVQDEKGMRVLVHGCGESDVYQRAMGMQFTAASQVVFAGVRGGEVYRVTLDAADCR